MRGPRGSDGFSLIEVLVAVLVLATAAAGAAGLCATAVASTRTARVKTMASLLAVDKLERLRGLRWAYDAGGVPVSDSGTDLSVEPAAAGGSGLGPSPVDSLDRNTEGFVDYLDVSGRWVGTGVRPPPRTVFTRRWRVRPLPADPADTIIIEVGVWLVPEAGPADARVVSVKTRKAR